MEHKEGVEGLVVTSQPQAKKFHLNKWHVITGILIAVIVVQGFLYLNLSSNYNILNANHKSLTSEHQNLSNEYDALTYQYSELQSAHSTLQGNYYSLQSNYNSLQSSYSSLQTHHNSLQSDYNSLQSNYNSYVSTYDNLRNQINKRALQLSVTDFIAPNDPAVQSIVYAITGGWTNTSDWLECWTDTKMMYDWVVNNIEYRSDGLFPVLPSTPANPVEYKQEMWQLPKETLDLMQGDCEDMAILLTSMLRCYDGDQYKDECIMISGSISGHVGVQISVKGSAQESLLTILDPAGHYYTQTAYGDIDSKDISTEINSWLNYWKPSLGSDVRVDRVFSNHLDKSFSSTSEYTSWMYSR